jgi:hypothetical protein
MPLEDRRITPADILPSQDYAARRSELRKKLILRKNNRRVEVGPFATFHFENYDTMWLQVHEMLHVEKGGEQQIAGELEAYNPLIPQGRELIATLMLEIQDPIGRDRILRQLGGIEETVSMEVDGVRIKAAPTEYEDRTTPDGKTSSIHWLRFSFSPENVDKFRSGTGRVVLEIAHPNYGHMAVPKPEIRSELAKDLTG